MERIRSAIEKARASRQERDGAGAAGPRQALVAARPKAVSESASLWDALSLFQPDPVILERHRIVAFQSGPAATPYDVMRTKLIHQLRANNWRRVAITSPSAGCGKTTTSLNLAFSLARQPELRVMLIDLDLRRPSIAQVLGMKAQHRFFEVLEGKAPAEEHVLRYGANLALATNNSPLRNPAELLQGVACAAAIDALEERYRPDVMIFDLPPMLVNDDTMAFIDQVDCALLIGAAGATTIAEIDRCERELAARTNVLGVVLNKCRYLEKGEAYSYDSY